MFFGLCFCIFFVGWLAWATWRGRDAWPFSHYPMFAGRHEGRRVEVFRVALETADGNVIWWRSRFYRYPQEIGEQLKTVAQIARENPQYPFLAPLEQRKYVREVLRLLRLEGGSSESYRAVRIVRRTVTEDLQIRDETVARFDCDSAV